MNVSNVLKLILLLSFALLCGCTSVNYSASHKKGTVESIDGAYKRILITNYGYYLFNSIPLGSGGDAEDSFSLFTDNVNLNAAMDMFNAECKKNNVTEVSDLQVEKTETCYFSWAPWGTTLGIYWYKEIQISATVSVNDSENTSIATIE